MRSPAAGLAAMVVLTLGLAGSAVAATHKILVLPLDGTADAATRTKLTAQIVRLAKGLDGQVGVAEATFADTALAVGCDPQAPSCRDEVIATLGIEELVWGTATKDGGRTRLVVRRAVRGAPAREVSTTIAAGESIDRSDTGIAALFAPPAAAPEPTAATPTRPTPRGEAAVARPAGSDEVAPRPIAPPGPTGDRRDRNVGIALVAGGGASLVLGIALLASYASLQHTIDTHATRVRGDFDDLKVLEDRAATYAIAGDLVVVAGLAAGGLGAYFLYRGHNRHRIAVAPAPIKYGAGLTLTLLGGL